MTQTIETAGADAQTHSSSNVRHLSRTEIPGGGQVVIQGSLAYVGHQHGPEGTSILDISDPRHPRIISQLMTSHPWSHSHKVRVVGDLMVVNSEIEPGKGDRASYPDGGFRLYDIGNPANPKLISFVKTNARGVHRFDLDQTYAYISTEMEGFEGNILVIYDIRNPSKPVEVSRWWMPGQNVAAGEPPHPRGRDHALHHAMRCGQTLFAGCWFSGVSIIDVSDIEQPRTLARHEYDPPHPEPTHTFLGVPFPIAGRRIAVSTEEERPKRGPDTGKPHAPLRIWDVTDLRDPKILCTYQLDERSQPYHGDDVRFGTHQLREIVDPDCMLYVTWFAAGLRMIDISDPVRPKERGYFIPQPTHGKRTPWTNDVAKDERGLLFVTDKVRGLDVIEFDN
ncbi:MAG TPA: RNA polymerase subunit sigma-70 [Xanthobacteraceae bacterium]|nr:RNA polymerase subunit sigma-70 [Xanthobacteraceae bacterium]